MRTRWWLAAYVALSLCSGLAASRLAAAGEDTSYWIGDNNVLIMLASVSLYLGFSRLRLRSRAINSLAGASLGCYLLQDGEFGHRFLYHWQEVWMWQHGHYYRADMYVMFLLSFVAIWGAAWVLQILSRTVSIRRFTEGL